jgi:hypothetical protein
MCSYAEVGKCWLTYTVAGDAQVLAVADRKPPAASTVDRRPVHEHRRNGAVEAVVKVEHPKAE